MRNILICLLLLFFITSCVSNEIEFKKEIVKNKTIDLFEGTTRYNIAFKSGTSDAFSYGLYEKYNIGDTICFQRYSNDVIRDWYLIECNKCK